MTSSQQRQLSKLIGSHKSTHLKFVTRVNNYIRLSIALRVLPLLSAVSVEHLSVDDISAALGVYTFFTDDGHKVRLEAQSVLPFEPGN